MSNDDLERVTKEPLTSPRRQHEELTQLAHLLRVGAKMARDIGFADPVDFQEIRALANEADALADALDKIARRSKYND